MAQEPGGGELRPARGFRIENLADSRGHGSDWVGLNPCARDATQPVLTLQESLFHIFGRCQEPQIFIENYWVQSCN